MIVNRQNTAIKKGMQTASYTASFIRLMMAFKCLIRVVRIYYMLQAGVSSTELLTTR